MEKKIISAYQYLKRYPKLLLAAIVFLFIVFTFFASKLDLQEDISKFLPKDEAEKELNFVLSNMDLKDEMLIQIYSPLDNLNKDYSIEASEYFISCLDTLLRKGLVEVDYKVSDEQIFKLLNFVHTNMPYYLDSNDYSRLDSLLKKELIYNALKAQKNLLGSAMGSVMLPQVERDPLSINLGALQKFQQISTQSEYGLYDGYYFSTQFDAQVIVVRNRISAMNTSENKEIISSLRRAISQMEREFPEIKTHFFSASDIALTNAERIKKDSYWAIGLSMLLILVLLSVAFRKLKLILLLFLPVVFGALFALCIIYFMQGSISIVAIATGSIIFGIAISYSIHFISHYIHTKSIELTIRELFTPMTIGSFSTIGAFLSILFIHSDAMRDFGLFAAFSLVGAILFSLFFLPHLLPKKTPVSKIKYIEMLSKYRFENNRKWIYVVVILSILFFVFSKRVSFETNMQKINFMTDEQKESMQAILADDSSNQIFVFSAFGENMSQAIQSYQKASKDLDALKEKGRIISISSATDFIIPIEQQREKIALWNKFWEQHSKENVKQDIESNAMKLGFREHTFDPFFNIIQEKYKEKGINYFAEDLPFLKKFYIETPEKSVVLAFLKVPNAFQEEVSQILNSENTLVFNPITIQKARVDLLVDDFNLVLYICGVIVFVLLWLSFGRLEIALIAFFPIALSWVWILGIMGIFGIHFNVVNIILAAFIFGLGDDFSIFITDGLLHESTYDSQLTNSHKNAVILSALTMIFGIGTLIFAQHPAMLSLAQVTIIGMLSVVILTYTIPPTIFKFILTKNGKARRMPITLKHLVLTIYAFSCFILGSIYLSFFGIFLLILGKNNEKNKLCYHKRLCRVANFSVANMPFVKQNTENLYEENFSKPAIIIANHQSHLDVLYLLILNPKIIILTNKWVWNSPFYGLVIRFADYFPIVKGIENSYMKLKPMIDKGYSVVVFPEGTRSDDEKIRRFHKGAFYLADKLGVDILPIVHHGIGNAFPKREFLLRDSHVTLSILKRIKLSSDYLGISKKCRELIMQEYKRLGELYEVPSYHIPNVMGQYIYKSYWVERQAKKELSNIEKNTQWIECLPLSGVVLIRSCGIGVFPMIGALVRKELLIYACEEDPIKMQIAKSAKVLPLNLVYISSEDANNMEFDRIIDYEA